ncbi:MAG: TolC family protein [Deltaproteobacteria bacterium]|nr:TolC family protein [Deltaproteobacteria bacterium]
MTPSKLEIVSADGAWVFLWLALLAAARSAGAQAAEVSLPTDATLTQLIDQSLSARPELARAEAVVHAEEERIPQAGALPDPMLQIGIQNDGFTSIEIGRMDSSFLSFMGSQTFPWPGKLGLRTEAAELGATQAKQGVSRVRLSTEADVRRAYLDLVLVRDRLGLLDQLEAIWQKSLGLARVRYEAGDGAQSDVLRAQLELKRIQQRRVGLQAEERATVQGVNRLRAHPLDEAIATTMHIRELPELTRFEGWFSADRAIERSPELAAARLGIMRADRSVALAEKSYYPDLTVGAGIMVRGQLPPMWLVTVGGPLPVFAGSKQSRAVAENRAWSSASQSEAVAIEQLLRLRSGERHTAFSALLEIVDLYAQGLLIQSEATSESTLSQYKVGKVSFASVLEVNAGFIADQEGYLESVAAAYRILIAETEVSLATTPMAVGAAGGSGAMPGASSASMESISGQPSRGNGEPVDGAGSTSGM